MTAPTVAPAGARPLICIHGYSSNARAFDVWRARLEQHQQPVKSIYAGAYVSLTNEVTIKDIAQGFDRALKLQAGLAEDEDFDVMVHSTGMLVIRSWLATYPARRGRLRHLIAIAPATTGSPLAHKGRTWLGSVFKGNKEPGPDFLEAGDLILDALELGSAFTWDLSQRDLFGPQPCFGAGADIPYVFVFCGNSGYGGLRKLITEDGTDGTVRWAGCSLNSRQIEMDLTRPASDADRVRIGQWHEVTNVPVTFVDNVNHGTITSDPPDALVDLVVGALAVSDPEQMAEWNTKAQAAAGKQPDQWQQFVVRVVDERGDGVADYNITLHGERNDGSKKGILEAFEMDVHAYARDRSYRNFHINLSKLQPDSLKSLHLELTASSGTKLVGYFGESGAGLAPSEPVGEVLIDMTPLLKTKSQDQPFTLFYPFTTTFVKIMIRREALPPTGSNQVYWF